jgi:hypothetical protein
MGDGVSLLVRALCADCVVHPPLSGGSEPSATALESRRRHRLSAPAPGRLRFRHAATSYPPFPHRGGELFLDQRNSRKRRPRARPTLRASLSPTNCAPTAPASSRNSVRLSGGAPSCRAQLSSYPGRTSDPRSRPRNAASLTSLEYLPKTGCKLPFLVRTMHKSSRGICGTSSPRAAGVLRSTQGSKRPSPGSVEKCSQARALTASPLGLTFPKRSGSRARSDAKPATAGSMDAAGVEPAQGSTSTAWLSWASQLSRFDPR